MKFNETLDHLLRALRMNEEDTDLHPAGAGSAGVMRSPGSVPRSPLPANPLPPWVVRDLSDGSDSVGESSDQTSDEADAAEATEAEESDEVDDTTEIVRRVLAASPPPLPAHLEPEEPAGDVRQSGNGSLTEQSSVGAATETGSLEHRGVPAPDSQSAPLTADEEPVAQPTTVSRWTDSAEDSWRFPVVEPSETAEPEAVEDHEDIAVTGALDHAEPPVLQPSERDATDATVEPARAEVVLPSPSATDDREAASAEPFVPGEPVSAAGQADLAALADEFETAPSEDAPDGPSGGPESDLEPTTSVEESSELGVSTVAHEAASSDAEVMETSAASPVPRQPDFASLEKAAILAESLNLGFHLGSAVERIAIAAAEGSAGVSALREASWLIDRYIALLEGRPIGADLHRSAVLLTQTGETIAGMKALVDALDLEAHRTQPSEPPAVPTVPSGAE